MKLISYIFSLLLIFIYASCEDDFSPKNQFRDLYIMNCVIGVENPAAQYSQPHEVRTAIYRTYDDEGLASTGVRSSLVRGATIKLTSITGPKNKKKEYDFTDTAKSQSGISILEYYIPRTTPVLSPLDVLNITATMPDGRTITSETVVPDSFIFEMNYSFPQGITPKINQKLYGNGVKFSWINSDESHFLFPQLTIPYTILSTNESKSIDVPLRYYTGKDGKAVPLYPSLFKGFELNFEFAALDSALKKISEGIQKKRDIQIGRIEFKILEYDTPLSTYYSSSNGFLDYYSVRLEENIYTNIRGGAGIFGCYLVHRFRYFFEKTYIESLGYKYNKN